TSTTTNPVPFNTTFVADPNLPVGEQVVDKQGVNGVDTITSTQEIKDGKPVDEPTITTERTKEPVDAVVRVGTKTEG
ncbi:G5 domain-containing protein, partial [Cutibacterium acnes subsp. acnes]|nr:G5 domain-containing protein [Cutibacterium acnes subsp. acnes]